MAPPPRNRSILICCMGTRGDVQPFVALALHLQQQRGWHAVLAAVSRLLTLLFSTGCARRAHAALRPTLLQCICITVCCAPPSYPMQPPEFRGFITSYGLQHEDIGISLAHAFAASPQVGRGCRICSSLVQMVLWPVEAAWRGNASPFIPSPPGMTAP